MKRGRGIFITLEGPEGAGKTTQGRLLARWLKRQGCSVLLTREPGGTRIGQRLRRILLDVHSGDLDPFTELCLYEASRQILVQEVIEPALKKGKVVIVDRFLDSTWVYQGWAGRLDLRLIEEMNRQAVGKTIPQMTILLDLPVEKGLRRVKRPNRMEAKELAFHRSVRIGYLRLARRDPRRIRIVPADRPLKEVQRQIQEEVSHLLR